MLRCDAAAAAARPRVPLATFLQWLAFVTGLAAPWPGVAAPTELSAVPLATFATGSAVDIKPNILMVLDDSGSMDWPYLPDWANDVPRNYSGLPPFLTRNASFNGVAYNPAIRYLPPVTFTSSGAKDTTTYPGMNGMTAATGADMSQPLPNWRALPFDGYKVQTTGAGTRPTENLEASADYYTVLPGEYCDSPALTNCTPATAPTGLFQYPAPLRWCSNNALTNCRGLWSSTFSRPRIAAPRMATLTFPGGNNVSVTSIRVDGLEILAAATPSQGNGPAIADAVADAINRCSFTRTGNCSTVGYIARASVNSNVVRIYAPGVTSATPEVLHTGNITVARTAFARDTIPLPDWHDGTGRSTNPVPGENVRTVLTRGVDSYAYPGSTTKAATRTDCAPRPSNTCTYQEEMTNMANWWAYYRTRMQMMKTATARTFASLDSEADIAAGRSRYRVGYLSINNNTGGDFVNIADFGAAQKFTWFSKLLAARPQNSTPLRSALSTAGRLYAGKLNGQALNGTTVSDPLQFSCQRNYTILSTDGYWNGPGGVKLDGTTPMDNQDGPMARPYNDGGAAQNQARTSELQQRVSTQTAEMGTLQRQVSQLQSMESRLQMRVDQLQTRTFRNGAWSDWSDANSCVEDNSGNNRRECRTVQGTFTNAASCRTGTNAGQTTLCQYADGPWTNAGSCSPVNKPNGPNFNVATARSCRTVVATPFTNASACTVTTTPNAAGQTTQCQYAFAPAAATASCAPAFVANNFSNPNVFRNCTTNQGTLTNVASCTATTTPDDQGRTVSCSYSAWSAWSNVASCTAAAQSAGPNFTVGTARECQLASAGGTANTLADIAAYYYNRDLRDPTATGADATGTCTGPLIPPSNRTNDLCVNNVQPFDRDTSTKQHMTTHTLGLGAQGQMVFSNFQNDLAGQRVFQPDYWLQQSGDFFAVANGSTASPSTGICPWLNAGSTCTWPTPAPDSTANIDDLWHAAVNGHGSYFSAADPVSLSDALSGVLAKITNPPRPGTAAAAATSNPNVTSGDNFIFSSSYKSVDWFGELIMQRLNDDGTPTRQQWSAMQLLDCATTPWQATREYKRGDAFQQGGRCYVVRTAYTAGAEFDGSANGTDGQNILSLNATPATRNILTVGTGTGAGTLVPFTWATLGASQRTLFERAKIKFSSQADGLTQFCNAGAACLTDTAQDAAAGEPLVNFLRGDRTNEGTWFRKRTHVLGDIVSSSAVYVKQPLQNYVDTGYAEHQARMARRAPTVYVGANDGMLHAFDALTGQERWAFIPSAVLPEIYRLADVDYASKHRYFVDGAPSVGEICPKAAPATCSADEWMTILVGGLNQGGKAYYALDITDPAQPRLLWEFTRGNLGFSYSNPRITKLRNGNWVVLVASGYNNNGGVGELYVLNAATGAEVNTISTRVGSPENPSGLAKLQGRVPNGANNTVEQVYAGDLLGNLWRFDLNDEYGAPGTDAQLLVQFRDANGNPQPITTNPDVATVADKPMVMVGTGRYLGVADLSDTRTYTMYAVKDKLDAVTLPTPRNAGSNFVQQFLTEGECPQGTSDRICSPGQIVRTVTSNPVDWSVKNGWFIDFAQPGERSISDPILTLGTLVFTSITPQPPVTGQIVGCSGTTTPVDAKSFLYYLDYLTGGAVQGTKNVAGEELCSCVATSASVLMTQKGELKGIIRASGGSEGDDDIIEEDDDEVVGSNMGETIFEELLFAPPGGPPRRLSWRELNGE